MNLGMQVQELMATLVMAAVMHGGNSANPHLHPHIAKVFDRLRGATAGTCNPDNTQAAFPIRCRPLGLALCPSLGHGANFITRPCRATEGGGGGAAMKAQQVCRLICRVYALFGF